MLEPIPFAGYMEIDDMNNEPVAWMWNEDGCNLGVVLDQDKQIGKQEFQDYNIPLYTHPAKILTEPSVKEITDLWLDVINNIPANDKRPREWHFANAILRKASEK